MVPTGSGGLRSGCEKLITVAILSSSCSSRQWPWRMAACRSQLSWEMTSRGICWGRPRRTRRCWCRPRSLRRRVGRASSAAAGRPCPGRAGRATSARRRAPWPPAASTAGRALRHRIITAAATMRPTLSAPPPRPRRGRVARPARLLGRHTTVPTPGTGRTSPSSRDAVAIATPTGG